MAFRRWISFGRVFSMTAQQAVNYYTNLHRVDSVTNRPSPAINGGPMYWSLTVRINGGATAHYQQDPFGGNFGLPVHARADQPGSTSTSPILRRVPIQIFQKAFHKPDRHAPWPARFPLAVGSNDV